MKNETQNNAKRLIDLLMEGKLKRKSAPLVIFIILAIIVGLYFAAMGKISSKEEQYYMGRKEYFNINDFFTASQKGVDLTCLGENGDHILYFIAGYKYDLTLLKKMKEQGLDFNKRNDQGLNVLEQVLLQLEVSEVSLTGPFQENLKTLKELGFTASDESIRIISKKCEKVSRLTCLKMVYYFKGLGMNDHAKSYAKRTCYEPKNEDLCLLAQEAIKKD